MVLASLLPPRLTATLIQPSGRLHSSCKRPVHFRELYQIPVTLYSTGGDNTEFASPIRVSDLATRFRVSRRTLETHFRAMTGTTIAEEVMRLRIEHAKRLLATTSDSQERIASACGFYNASHLGAVFRRRCGAPPSSFR